MNIYETSCRLKNRDVSLFRTLKVSRLFEFLQEASIAHTEELGAGRVKTLDRGLLWVVMQQEMKISRMPEYDEEIRIISWPGETMHVLFPRFYRICDDHDQVIAEGSALWALMDQETRKIVFPERFAISISGILTGNEYSLPSRIREEQDGEHMMITVPFSWCDLNGHMNNTRYFDLMDDLMQNGTDPAEPYLITAEYHQEIPCGEELSVKWKKGDDIFFMEGNAGGKPAFRIRAEFAADPVSGE